MSHGPIVTVAISAFSGVFAWVVTNFLAEPLITFYRRRRSIRESLLYVANIDREIKGFDAAYDELRRHAAALDALDETAPRIVKAWLRWRGYDMTAAARALMGFGNSLGSHDGSRGTFRDRLRKAMRYRGESIS